MKVALPYSGGFAEFRDRPKQADISAARRAMKFITAPDGSRIIDGTFIEVVASAIIRQMLVQWDIGLPTPAQIHTAELWDQVWGGLDADDSAALQKAVGPWVERVMEVAGFRGPAFIHKATGVRVEVAEKDIPALAASGDFTRDEGSDPKNASRAIGISSSESPAPDGQTTETTDSTPPSSS